jgi:poly-beta-hydroxyalkanoate depolymerase
VILCAPASSASVPVVARSVLVTQNLPPKTANFARIEFNGLIQRTTIHGRDARKHMKEHRRSCACLRPSCRVHASKLELSRPFDGYLAGQVPLAET